MRRLTMTLGILLLFVTLAACNTNETSYKDPDGNEYKYKLELTGTLPNASNESTFIVLTNDKTLIFEKVSKSIFSSNSKDSEGIHFYLLPNNHSLQLEKFN